MVLNQGQEGKCKNASFLAALEIMGKIDNTQEILDAMDDNFLTNEKASKYFQSLGLIKGIKRITPLKFKGVLARGIPIITGTNGYSKESIRKPPYIMRWEDRIGSHSFIIVSYHDGLLKCQNSWGEEECDKGYFYIRKEDIKKLISPIILI